MPRGASFLNPALGRAAWMWAALPSVCALSTLPTGMALTGDGHWQVGLEGTSLRGQTARGASNGGSTAQVWECPRTQASISPKTLFTLGGGVWMAEGHPSSPQRLAVGTFPHQRDRGMTVCLGEGVSGLPTLPGHSLHYQTCSIAQPPGRLQHQYHAPSFPKSSTPRAA